ncbi:MAG: hypothetical protein OXI60_11010 [Acidiferrobacterales bacterium]|nr:hypothetical protein [Acidiferrobacterales bacterium]
MDSLATLINGVKQNLITSVNAYPSEASVSVQIVIPVLTHLGWDTTDPNVVVPEYSVNNRRVDYALIVPKVSANPRCIIEVKALGKVDADQQLFEYAFHTGVALAFLTDGREWRVYLPIEPGSYQERLVRTFDFAGGDENQIANDLRELLSYDNVASGKSIEIAKNIKEKIQNRNLARSKISEAWGNLTSGEEAIFVEFLIEETSRICGFAPEQQDVIQFFENLRSPSQPTSHEPRVKLSGDKSTRTSTFKGKITYCLFGEEYTEPNYGSAYVKIMEVLAPRLSTQELKSLNFFYERKADMPISMVNRARPVRSGSWWISTHSNTKTKFRHIKIVCNELSVKFQSEEGVLLPDPNQSKSRS